MSSGIAFLSPPSSSIYDPLQVRTASFTTQPSMSTAFRPQFSSPLRTSRNANIMPIAQEQKNNANTSQQLSENSASKDTTGDVKPFFFLGTSTGEVRDKNASRATQFQFESRARSSSPSIQLHSQVVANRTARKKVHLDRIRGRRDDARFERTGEQILRMDWLNERKAWEQEMSRNSFDHGDLVMEDEDMLENEGQIVSGGMSPTEEKELEELVSYFEHENVDEFDDGQEDYDALFMEVLSQDADAEESGDASKITDVEMT